MRNRTPPPPHSAAASLGVALVARTGSRIEAQGELACDGVTVKTSTIRIKAKS